MAGNDPGLAHPWPVPERDAEPPVIRETPQQVELWDFRIRPTLGVPRLFWASGSKIVGLIDPDSPYSGGGVEAELARLSMYELRLIETALRHALDVIGARKRGASADD